MGYEEALVGKSPAITLFEAMKDRKVAETIRDTIITWPGLADSTGAESVEGTLEILWKGGYLEDSMSRRRSRSVPASLPKQRSPVKKSSSSTNREGASSPAKKGPSSPDKAGVSSTKRQGSSSPVKNGPSSPVKASSSSTLAASRINIASPSSTARGTVGSKSATGIGNKVE